MLYRSEMWTFIIAAVIIVVLIAITWQRRHISSGRSFILLMLCALVWTATFMLEIAAQSLELKVLFVKMQFIAIGFLPVAWLNLIITYVGQNRPRKDWLYLSIIPVITDIFIWFVPRPNLFWNEPSLISGSAPLTMINYDYGFWFYYVHAPYGYLLILAALSVLIRAFLKSHSVYKYQIMVMIVAILLPVITDILYVLGYSPIKYFNYTTAVFSISCLIITYALFRYKFLDLLPMARDVVIENMEDGLIVLDQKKRIVDVNTSAMMVTGICKDDIGQLFPKVCPRLFCSTIGECYDRDIKQVKIEVGEKNETRIFEIRISYIKDKIGKMLGSVVTLRDYTEQANLFNKMREQAINDSLTGIYNRRHFFELGHKEISRTIRQPEKCVSLIMIDVDNFKGINDTYGHVTGDKVLLAFAEVCKNSIRKYDILGRLGGDEFAIVLPETTLEEAIVVARRINSKIESMRIQTTMQDEISMKASMGVVSSKSLNLTELDFERMYIFADEEMYKSKYHSRNIKKKEG